MKILKLGKALKNLKDFINVTAKKSKTFATVPFLSTPKMSNTGLCIEKNTAAATKAFNKFELPLNISSKNLRRLEQLYESNPQKFQEMYESGIFKLIEEGRLTQDILINLGKNRFLTPNILKDIKQVSNGKTLIAEIPANTKLQDIAKYVDNGEVGILNGKLYANQNGNAVELKLSKEKFEELFPLIERFKTRQGYTGDCWLISGITTMMENPNTRVDVYKLFSQIGDDILIKYPIGVHQLKFAKGQTFNHYGKLSEGSKGVEMLEQSYVFHRQKLYTKNATETNVIERLQENPRLIQKLEGGKNGEFSDAVYGKDDMSLDGWMRFFRSVYDEMKYNLLTSSKNKTNAAELGRWTKNKSYPVTYSCDFSNKKMIEAYDLYAPHAYSLTEYNPTRKIASISNPHYTEVIIDTPLDVLEEYGHFAHLGRF